MPNFVRLPLFAAIVLLGSAYSGSLYADSESVDADLHEPAPADSTSGSAATNKQTAPLDTPRLETSSWLEGIRNTCAQQYSIEQCRDDEFLEQNFHVGDLQTAHRAAVRRNEMEQSALRELLLQRTCGNPAAYCAINATPDCATQLQQMCTSIQQQTANCLNTAVQYCATTGQSSNCLAQRSALCPTAKWQPIDKLLAKYPKLTLQQQAHVRQVAQQIDANQGGNWLGNLLRLLGF